MNCRWSAPHRGMTTSGWPRVFRAVSSGGGTIGERLSRWILTGDPGMDMSEIDARRFGNFVSKRWTAHKVHETWGTHMEFHVPGEDRPAARPAKTAPSYDLLTTRGAVWTVLDGWEFPRWFAPSPELAVPESTVSGGRGIWNMSRPR